MATSMVSAAMCPEGIDGDEEITFIAIGLRAST